MKSSLRRVRGTGVFVLVLLLVAGLIVVTPSAEAKLSSGSDSGHPRAGSCTSAHQDDRVKLSILTPRAGASIKLQATPRFDVTGEVRGGNIRSVTAVQLIADGTLVGTAQLTSGQRRDDDARKWVFQTSAPGGNHTLTACAITASGPVAAASVTVTVVEPSPTATVVAPDVLTLTAATLSTVTATDATSVTFAKPPALAVGQVIVAGVSPTTPSGLMRRVTALTRAGSNTVAMTQPASLTDVFWQVDIDKSDVPVPPEAPAATPVTGSGLRSALSAAAAPPASSSVLSRTFTIKRNASTCPAGSKCTATGTVDVQATASVTLTLTLTAQVSIRIKWAWGIPTPQLTHAKFAVSGTGVTDLSASATGKGNLQSSDTVVPNIKLATIPLSEIPPVVIQPSVGIDAAIAANLALATKLQAKTTVSIETGVEYKNGQVTPIATASVKPETTAPWTADGTTGSASLSLGISPHLEAEIDLSGGPVVGVEGGIKAALAYPCPGKATLDAYGKASIGGSLEFFQKKLASFKTDSPTVTESIFSGSAFGCQDAPAITDEVLPPAVTGTQYQTTVHAAGGTAPYTWTATGVPEGLTMNSDGTLTGTPVAAGTPQVTVTVTDAAGKTGSRVFTLTVSPQPLTLDTHGLSDAVAGLSYTGQFSASGGTGPYAFTADPGSLPEGINLSSTGALTGAPSTAAAGAHTIQVTVTDAGGVTVSGPVSITVDPALPAPVPADVTIAPGPPAPPCGAACAVTWGDPHLVTFDGARFDAQAAGELIAAKSTTDDFEIQVRQQPWLGSRLVAVNVATAMTVSGHRVGVYLTNTGTRTLIDGQQATPTTTPTPLPGGGTITQDTANNLETIQWPDGSFVTAAYVPGSHISLTISLAAARIGQMKGLLGNADHDSTNDLTSRDGQLLPYPGSTPTDILTKFASTWRISQTESLFDYDPGQTTDTFTDSNFPYAQLTAAQLPTANADAATAACKASGVTDQATLDACTLDVAISGNPNLAGQAVTAQTATTPTNSTLADGDFETPQLTSGFTDFGTGSTIGPWTVTSGAVDLVHSDYWQAAGGHQSIDLNGCAPGRIAQTIHVQPNQRYVATFSYAGNPETPDKTKLFHVEINGTPGDSYTFATTNTSVQAMGWKEGAASFVVQGTTVEIAFASDTPNSCGGPTLDNLNIAPAS